MPRNRSDRDFDRYALHGSLHHRALSMRTSSSGDVSQNRTLTGVRSFEETWNLETGCPQAPFTGSGQEEGLVRVHERGKIPCRSAPDIFSHRFQLPETPSAPEINSSYGGQFFRKSVFPQGNRDFEVRPMQVLPPHSHSVGHENGSARFYHLIFVHTTLTSTAGWQGYRS